MYNANDDDDDDNINSNNNNINNNNNNNNNKRLAFRQAAAMRTSAPPNIRCGRIQRDRPPFLSPLSCLPIKTEKFPR